MPIAPIRQIELATMLALPLRRTLHRQTQEFESPLLQAPSLRPPKISGRDKKKTEQDGTLYLRLPSVEGPLQDAKEFHILGSS
jgi:hypothetical protein